MALSARSSARLRGWGPRLLLLLSHGWCLPPGAGAKRHQLSRAWAQELMCSLILRFGEKLAVAGPWRHPFLTKKKAPLLRLATLCAFGQASLAPPLWNAKGTGDPR